MYQNRVFHFIVVLRKLNLLEWCIAHFNRQDVRYKRYYSAHVTLEFFRDTKWRLPAYIEKNDNFEDSQKMQYLLINCEARN